MRAGFTMVPNAVLRGEVDLPDGKRLSLGARVLYAAILDYSHAGKRPCWASKESLAEHVGVSIRHVYNLLRELERAEVVVVRREGRGRTNTVTPLVLPERKRGSDHPRKSGSTKQDWPDSKNEGGSKEGKSGNSYQDGSCA